MSLTIDKETATKLYPDAPAWFQEEIKEKFGKKDFIKDWSDIKTYEDAVEFRPVDEDDIIYPTDRPHIVDYKQLCHIKKAINGDWQADYTNEDQRKWFPVFRSAGSGFDFSGSYSCCDGRGSDVGSRLVFESQAKSDYAGKIFIKQYNNL